MNEQSIDRQRRFEAKERYIAAAKKIVDKTQDTEARAVLDYALSNVVTIAPVPRGVMYLETPTSDVPWVGLLPFFLEDANQEGWRRFAERNDLFAFYQASGNCIVVREEPACSKFWKGIILLHEAHHASDMLHDPFDWKDPQSNSENEVVVRNFQHRLMVQLGGFAYRKLLRKEVARLRAGMEMKRIEGVAGPSGVPVQITMPGPEHYPIELDEIFHPALSELERYNRRDLFWNHAVFAMIEQDLGPGQDAENRKTSFMRMIGIEAGMF